MIKNAKYNLKTKNIHKLFKKCFNFAVFIIIVLIIVLYKITPKDNIFAESETDNIRNEETIASLENETNKQLNELDLDEIELQLNQLSISDYSLFSGLSFKEVVSKIINGEFEVSFGLVFSSLKDAVVSNFKHMLSLLLVCVAICLLFSIYKEFITNSKLNFIGVIRLLFFAIASLILLQVSSSVIKSATSAIASMQTQMNIIFPIIIALMSASGGVVSVKCYSPALAFMSQIVSNVFAYFLLPLFVFNLALTVVENLTDSRSFSGLKGFISSLFKWTIGIVCTTFLSVLTIEGVVSGGADGISIKATKYAIKNYVPYLGGYVSDGFALMKASSIILKNAIGLASILLLIITTLAPVLSIAVLSLGINLISAIVSPIGEGLVSKFLQSFASCFKMLLAIVLGVALMYFYILCLSVLTLNVI